MMPNRTDTGTVNGSRVNRFAQVIERIGLAITGALCGFFVAALVAKANIEEVNSVGVLLSAVLYGSIGFYLGISIPSLPSDGPYRTDPIALASATGTFLAATAALVSIYIIVFDEVPTVIWIIVIGIWWMFGVLLQLAAGTAARFGQVTSVTG